MEDSDDQRWLLALQAANIDVGSLDWRDTEDVDGACEILSITGFRPRNRLKGFLRRYSTPMYQVAATIGNARNENGFRAAVYYMAEESKAMWIEGEGKPIRYGADGEEYTTLFVSLLFDEKNNAREFATKLRNWKFSHPLSTSNLDDPVVDEIPSRLPLRDGLRPVLLVHYDAAEANDSPCTSLADFRGLPSSLQTEPVTLTEPLYKYQSIEADTTFAAANPYKLHIKDKAKFKGLRDDENNMLAGSWPFHQLFDGLNTSEGHHVPLLAIGWLGSNEAPTTFDDGESRFRVDLEIEFFTDAAEIDLKDRLKAGSQRSGERLWRTFVHVVNPTLFKECIDWKHGKAKRIWDDHLDF